MSLCLTSPFILSRRTIVISDSNPGHNLKTTPLHLIKQVHTVDEIKSNPKGSKSDRRGRKQHTTPIRLLFSSLQYSFVS